MELWIAAEGARFDAESASVLKAEECGFAGYSRADHLVRGGANQDWATASDVWTTMAGLAVMTDRIRLASIMTSSAIRHPAHLAVIVAQVDTMSNGRIELGLGAGSLPHEYDVLGIDLAPLGVRFDRLEEQLELLTSLWSAPHAEPFSYDGTHYQMKNYPARVPTVQQPHPPIIVGGHGPKRTPRLAARFADEFNIDWVSPADAAAAFERVDEACAAIDRQPDTLRKSVSLVLCCGRGDAEIARRAEVAVSALGEDESADVFGGAYGTPAQVVDVLARYVEVGVDRVYLESYDPSDLDHLELIASDVLPQITSSD